MGAVVQFGGQTAIKLSQHLGRMGVPVLGTSADDVDAAEDRERFDEILEKCGIPRPKGLTVFTTQEALDAAHSLGYPVLVRPSYVLGGQGMQIAFSDKDITEYMQIINRTVQELSLIHISTDCFTCNGVYSLSGIPHRSKANITTPRASATAIAVF